MAVISVTTPAQPQGDTLSSGSSDSPYKDNTVLWVLFWAQAVTFNDVKEHR